ncbi:MAG: tautomerase family protein [Thermodesulfobacteriota bacterium]|jgi:phenylpyruvate tautomerase PptA (4-oxalocrotonate tautomerase family)
MPLVTITIIEGKTREFRRLIFDAVHDSLVAALKIPDHDRNQRIVEIRLDNLEFPAGRTESFVTIEMTVYPGRSLQAKKALYQEIVSRLQRLEIQGDDILIVLNEPPLENWGIRGGYPASEVDIGFEINV